MALRRWVCAVFFVLAACGGGQSGSNLPPRDANAPPPQTPPLTPTPTPTLTPKPTPTPTPTATPAPTPSAQATQVTVAHWESAFSYGGKTYKYSMVGSNPMLALVPTTVGVEIVPVQLIFSDGVSLDATKPAATIANTPLFVNGSYASGTGQYGDEFMRSQFWKYANAGNYHVVLGKPLLEPTAQIIVPSSDGYTSTGSGRTEGYVTYAWFVQTIEPQELQELGIDPRTLTIFATYNTQVLQPGGVCCYAGYHSAFSLDTAYGPSIATTAWASVVPDGVEALSHEIGEWLDDPFYTNVVPSWLNPNSNGCNGDLLEVGDPVTNYTFSVNGGELQDLVFYSWFSRDQPSLGIDGRYDFMGKLTSPAKSCGSS